MEGKIVFKGKTKEGESFIIRYPQKEDLQEMLKYINALSAEKTFIRLQGEQLPLDEESEYLQNMLKKIREKKAVKLTLVLNNKIVGTSDVDMKDRTESHEGIFGLSIAKEYRGQGLGEKLMQMTLEEAKKQMSQLRIVALEVFANNPIAQALYRKFGFKEFGRLPEGIAYKGEFIDSIYMYKKIR